MKNINRRNWSLDGNKASVSLMNLHAKFEVLKNDNSIYYQLVVTDSNMDTLTFNFYTLEDVISFTENVVSECRTKEDVLNQYQQMYEEGEFRLPGGMKPPKKNKISLTPNEVDEALVGYFGEGKDYRISVKDEEPYIDFEGNPKVPIYLVEHIDFEGAKKEISYMLTDSDIKHALAHYIDFYGYDLEDFKYIGGIHHTGYFFDEDKPYYEGIELTVKEKQKEQPKKLKKTKNKKNDIMKKKEV